MEISAKQILKIVEQASCLKDVLDKKDEIASMMSRFEAAEEKLKRFGDMDDLIAHLNELEEHTYLFKQYLNTDEAAMYLGINKRTLQNAAQRNEIPYYALPSKYRYFDKGDLDKWIVSFRVPSKVKEYEEQH